MHPSTSAILLSLISFTTAQSFVVPADGLIVPFTSGLPACASNCGPLYDVQGKCTPPNIAAIDNSCFCTDSRLKPFDTNGIAGVLQVCGATSCTDATDQTAVKTWYDKYCAANANPSSTGGGASSTSTGKAANSSKPNNQSAGQTWLASHYKWVIMLVIMVILIVGGWVGASLLRKRYLRKKEREIEMRPPIAWGPHQMQGMSGGYNYGDGVTDSSRGGKDVGSDSASPVYGTKAKRESKGWLTKNRR